MRGAVTPTGSSFITCEYKTRLGYTSVANTLAYFTPSINDNKKSSITLTTKVSFMKNILFITDVEDK